MQFLAITSLLDFSIDIEEIKKIPIESKFNGNFSIELQEFLAENRIKALKNLIQIDFIDKIQKNPTRNEGIHRKFHIFYTDKYLNLSPNPVAELDLIIKELPTSIFTLNMIN
ncbi:MAG: hypothetical protein E6K54_03010 [Gammaproteobacteria bacterium]|nr:MAG: hypothetical protein E6K54_03010 [Gammaproteobacteria bacterium]